MQVRHQQQQQQQEEQEEQLIGWQGERAAASVQLDSTWDPLNLEASKPDDIPLPASDSWVEQIRWASTRPGYQVWPGTCMPWMVGRPWISV